MALAEFNRKEFQFRQERSKFEQERKAAEAAAAERAQNEERWKSDPLALLEQFGHKIDAVIDFAAKGGADSPEGRVRALETKLERKEREEKEARERAQQEADQRSAAERRQAVMAHINAEVGKLTKDPKFELCAATPGLDAEVARFIVLAWERDQTNLTIEQALELCETELDRRLGLYAQSRKLKAKLSPPAEKPKEEGKPEASRQDSSVPTAAKRTITIKNRQQAVAPIRKASDGRRPSAEVTREAAERLKTLFGSQR